MFNESLPPVCCPGGGWPPRSFVSEHEAVSAPAGTGQCVASATRRRRTTAPYCALRLEACCAEWRLCALMERVCSASAPPFDSKHPMTPTTALRIRVPPNSEPQGTPPCPAPPRAVLAAAAPGHHTRRGGPSCPALPKGPGLPGLDGAPSAPRSARAARPHPRHCSPESGA